MDSSELWLLCIQNYLFSTRIETSAAIYIRSFPVWNFRNIWPLHVFACSGSSRTMSKEWHRYIPDGWPVTKWYSHIGNTIPVTGACGNRCTSLIHNFQYVEALSQPPLFNLNHSEHIQNSFMAKKLFIELTVCCMLFSNQYFSYWPVLFFCSSPFLFLSPLSISVVFVCRMLRKLGWSQWFSKIQFVYCKYFITEP